MGLTLGSAVAKKKKKKKKNMLSLALGSLSLQDIGNHGRFGCVSLWCRPLQKKNKKKQKKKHVITSPRESLPPGYRESWPFWLCLTLVSAVAKKKKKKKKKKQKHVITSPRESLPPGYRESWPFWL